LKENHIYWGSFHLVQNILKFADCGKRKFLFKYLSSAALWAVTTGAAAPLTSLSSYDLPLVSNFKVICLKKCT